MKLIILGASGDLTARYLMPALAQLHSTGQHEIETILGVSREDWSTEEYRKHIRQALDKQSDLKPRSHEALLNTLEHRQADVTDADALQQIVSNGEDPVAIYLALPPAVFPPVLETLEAIRLPRGSRIVVEKPFGEDLASAQALNALLRSSFSEDVIFRIDHFLGKQTVQNVLGLRFANRVFEYLWNRDHIERIDIVWDETVALEGRAGYYDHAGALRDMVQNHLLQLLCLVGMEAPLSFADQDFRDRKVDVLRAVRTFSEEEAMRYTRRARYTAGTIEGKAIPNYVDEEGVDPDRMTETFAETTLFIDNWRWAGVPFVLRTGKAMQMTHTEIVVTFRPVPYLPFKQTCCPKNRLRLQMNPDRMDLDITINGKGDPFALESVALTQKLRQQEFSAYARLLADILEGDPVLSIRGDEAEESWRIVEPILNAWRANKVPMEKYAAGSQGPPARA